MDPEYDDFVSMAEEDEGALGGFSLVNVDKVNLLKHPKFKNVHWTYSNLTAGDCIFIPYGKSCLASWIPVYGTGILCHYSTCILSFVYTVRIVDSVPL